jgi:hypothetical protein
MASTSDEDLFVRHLTGVASQYLAGQVPVSEAAAQLSLAVSDRIHQCLLFGLRGDDARGVLDALQAVRDAL